MKLANLNYFNYVSVAVLNSYITTTSAGI